MPSERELQFILKMRDEASAILRQNAQAFGQAGQKVKDFKDSADRATSSLDQIVKVAKDAAGAVAGVFSSGKIALPALAAFGQAEIGLINVAKTTNMAGKELAQFEQGFKELAGSMDGIPLAELQEFAAVAGQFGIRGTKNILKFTEVMAKLSSAAPTIKGAEGAAEINRILTVTGEGVGQIEEFGDALATLGNQTAAFESDILSMTTVLATRTAQFGLTSKELLALGAAAKEVGLPQDLFGSAAGRVLLTLRDATLNATDGFKAFSKETGLTQKQLRTLIDLHPAEALLLFSEVLGRINEQGRSSTGLLEKLKINTDEVKAVFNTAGENVDVFREKLKLVFDAGTIGALDREAAKFFEAFNSKTEGMIKAWRGLQAAFGKALAPAVVPAIEGISAALDQLSEWLEALPDWLATIGASAIAVVPALLAIPPALRLVSLAFRLLASSTAVTLALSGMQAAFAAIPVAVGAMQVALVAATPALVAAAPAIAAVTAAITAGIGLDKATDWLAGWLRNNMGDAQIQAIRNFRREFEGFFDLLATNIFTGEIMEGPNKGKKMWGTDESQAATPADPPAAPADQTDQPPRRVAKPAQITVTDEQLDLIRQLDQRLELTKQITEQEEILGRLQQMTPTQRADVGINEESLARLQEALRLKKEQLQPVNEQIAAIEREMAVAAALTGEQRKSLEIEHAIAEARKQNLTLTEPQEQALRKALQAQAATEQANNFRDLVVGYKEQVQQAEALTNAERTRVEVVQTIAQFNRENLKLTEQQEEAIKAQIEALNQIANFNALRDQLDPQGAARRQYSDDVETLDKALRDGTVSLEQYERMLNTLKRQSRQAIDPIGFDVESIRRELESVQAVTAERKNELEIKERIRILAEQTGEDELEIAKRITQEMKTLQAARQAAAVYDFARDLNDQLQVARALNPLQRQRLEIEQQIADFERQHGKLAEGTRKRLADVLGVLRQIEGLNALRDQLDPQSAAIREYLANLQLLRDAYGETSAEYRRYKELLDRQTLSERDPIGERVRQMREEISLLELRGPAREVEARTLEDVNALLERGVTVTKDLQDAFRDYHAAIIAANEAQENGIQGFINSVGELENELGRVAKEGLEQLADTLADFVTDGEASFEDLANSAMRELNRVAIRDVMKNVFEGLDIDYSGGKIERAKAAAERLNRLRGEQMIQATEAVVNAPVVNINGQGLGDLLTPPAVQPGPLPGGKVIDEGVGSLGGLPASGGTATGVELAKRLQKDYGLSAGAAAGFAGNLAHESGNFRVLQEVKPLVKGSRGGYGWAQWTGPRRRQFEAFAKERGLDVSKPDTNYAFLRHELENTPEGAVLGKLKGVTDPQEATRIVSETYLRPGVPHMRSRYKRTAEIMAGLEKQAPASPPKVEQLVTQNMGALNKNIAAANSSIMRFGGEFGKVPTEKLAAYTPEKYDLTKFAGGRQSENVEDLRNASWWEELKHKAVSHNAKVKERLFGPPEPVKLEGTEKMLAALDRPDYDPSFDWSQYGFKGAGPQHAPERTKVPDLPDLSNLKTQTDALATSMGNVDSSAVKLATALPLASQETATAMNTAAAATTQFGTQAVQQAGQAAAATATQTATMGSASAATAAQVNTLGSAASTAATQVQTGEAAKAVGRVYHDGGKVGDRLTSIKALDELKSDEVPAILQTGEIVLSRKQVAAMEPWQELFKDAVRLHNGGEIRPSKIIRVPTPEKDDEGRSKKPKTTKTHGVFGIAPLGGGLPTGDVYRLHKNIRGSFRTGEALYAGEAKEKDKGFNPLMLLGLLPLLMSMGGGAGGLGSLLKGVTGMLGGLFHGGGKVGVTRVPQRAFLLQSIANLPRFHDGLASDEFLSVLKRNERVLTGQQEGRAIGAMQGSAEAMRRQENLHPPTNVTVHQTIVANDPNTFRATLSQTGAATKRALERAAMRNH
ncbi:phage tail tape measure protein [Sinorhizobium fredii]|uniref:phage tail tape measure protein n=1 Tax=Rhizobium fredii TaxID=380 RepID=UPI001297484D|nr:phage tail tape measure protein [Sinorhizobium fredii]MQW94054.1 phage tail tape measure protein [Sinorhizobium fredii]